KEFSFRDGLEGNRFFISQGEHGVMYLSGDGGFYSFSPSDIKRDAPRLSPVLITSITNLTTPKTEYILSNKFLVDYRSNSITIEFTALNFLGTHKNKY